MTPLNAGCAVLTALTVLTARAGCAVLTVLSTRAGCAMLTVLTSRAGSAMLTVLTARAGCAVAGELETLLDAYDRERRVLPTPVLFWQWGWTISAETWNGRIAMLAVIVILTLEAFTGRGVIAGLLLP